VGETGKERAMRRVLLVAVFLLVAVAPGAAATKQVTVTIHHQTRGCHAWAVGSSAYKPAQAVTVAPGTTITFVNNDVMAQKIVQKGGAKVTFVGKTNLNHSAASVKVVLSRPGVYRFGTIEGNDYFKGVKTIGPDNVLKLVVTVK
jgi:plastocyanin